MSENKGKPAVWIAAVLSVLVATALTWFWLKPAPRKPPAKPPLTTVGVGLYLARNTNTHQFDIRKVFPHSPAEAAGIVPGLVLTKVDGHTAETNNIKQLSALLSGPEGSKVTVELMDTNTGDTTNVEILRQKFLNRSTPTH